ncbi:MAG: transcriptional regulator [bacterium]|nr:transcriptional regulator [bacterium]
MENEKGKELTKVRNTTGMSRREFCEYFEIPYSTMTDWELGRRRVPQYLVRLMEYKIQMEKLEREKRDGR